MDAAGRRTPRLLAIAAILLLAGLTAFSFWSQWYDAQRMPTPAVNRALQDAVAQRQPPLVHGKRMKVIYGAQVQTRPPRFRITINDRKLITRDYAYFLENRLREAAGLEGCPVVIDLVER